MITAGAGRGRTLFAAVAALVTLTIFFGGMPAIAAEPGRTDYLISVTDASRADVAAGLAALDVTPSETFSEAFTGFQVALTDEQAAIIESTPGVEHLEAISLQAKAVDSQENPPSWNLDRLDQDVSVDNSTDGQQYWYPKTAGQGARVYVMDTGVVAARTGFNGRVTDGFDATYQGYLDRRAGLATFDNYNSAGSATNDCSGHGNAVASVVAGDTTGVAKKATIVPVRVLNCDGQGTNADIIRGIEWIMAHHPAGTTGIINMSFGYVDKDVAYTCDPNFPKECNYPTLVEQTVAAAVDAGFFVVAAAGNDSEPSTSSLNNPAVSKTVIDACDFTPARVPGVFTVGATDGGYDGTPERRATFSNAGQCVDAFAPGVNIRGFHRTSDSILTLSRGTSVAAPHVAGLAALLVAENPTITGAQITSQLKAAAVTGALTDTDTYPLNANTQYSTGKTLVNGSYLRFTTVNSVSPNLIVRSAIATPVRATEVTDVTLVNRSSSTLEISFTAPSNAVDAGVTHYRVSTRNITEGTTSTTTVASTKADGSAVTSTTITDLATNTPYQVTVTALADGYVGVTSATLNATTDLVYSAPDAPINPPSLLPGDAAHANTDSNIWVTYSTPTISASAATGNSPITGAVVRYSKDGQTWTETATLPITATAYQQVTLSNLSRATTYQVQYAWVNAYGQSGWSSVATSTTNAVAPTAPLAVHRTAATGTTLSLAWDAPADNGGYAISDYQVRYGAAIGTSCAGVTFSTVNVGSDARTFTVTGLTARTNYCVYVKAYTAFGWSGLSAALKTATTVDPTSAPEGLTAQPAVDRATITWEAPAVNGGQAAWDYMIEVSKDGNSWTILQDGTYATTAITITGLVPDTTYQVRVSARNDGGLSVASAPLTFNTLPAPTLTPASALTVSSITKNSLVLDWTDTNTGAAASSIAGYKIYRSAAGHAFETLPQVTGATLTTVTDLLPGTEYTFYIVTQSIYGTSSEASTTIEGTTLTGLATAPRFVTLTGTSTTSAALSWVTPEHDGGDTITGYLVRLSTDGGQTWTTRTIAVGDLAATLDGSFLTATLTGLNTGATYTATVNAVNVNGAGATSNEDTALIATAPSATTVTVAQRTSSALTFTWDVATANGSAVTGYRIDTLVDGIWTELATVDAQTLTYTVEDLQRASTHTYRVIAVNSIGASAATEVTATTLGNVPAAVTGVIVTAAATSAGVVWTAPADNGGSEITGYTVAYRKAGDSTWATITVQNTFAILSGLDKGTDYIVTVIATNATGDSTATESTTSTGTTVAGTIADLTTVAHATGIDVTWTAPADNGGTLITGYVVEYQESGAGTWTAATIAADTTAYSITGLAKGTTYTVRVHATNGAGAADAVSLTKRTLTTPASAVAGLTVTASTPAADSSATLAWTSPVDNGGNEVTGYTVKYRETTGGPVTAISTTDTMITINGLANGTSYEFTITANTFDGPGASSIISIATGEVDPGTGGGTDPGTGGGTGPGTGGGTQATAPDAVTDLTVTRTGATAVITWTAPVKNGGADITAYTVKTRARGASAWTETSVETTTANLTGLTLGTVYDVSVTATNSAGTSTETVTVTTAGTSAPGAPVTLTAVKTTSKTTTSTVGMTLTWAAPSNNGGSAISTYLVEYQKAGSATWTVFNHATSSATTLVVTGLSKGTSYTFRVSAVTTFGTGAAVTASAITDADASSAVRSLALQSRTRTSLTLKWTAPSKNGGAAIVDYVVQYRVSTSGTWKTLSDGVKAATGAKISGLSANRKYYIRVYAKNAAGKTSPVASLTTNTSR